MAAVLAPWPFLDGGAAAVQVATIFDGATVEEALLWRGAGGRAAARLGDGGGGAGVVDVRLGDGGFEVVLARACDGDVRVGERVVELRELSLCGVTALPIGPRTRVTVRAGMLTYAIAGTTPPKRLPRAAPVSWRRRAAVAVAALAIAGFGAALQSGAPRVPSWTIPDTVRVKVSLMMPSLHGGRAPSAVAPATTPHAAERARAKPIATTSLVAAKKVPNQDRAAKRSQPPSPPSQQPPSPPSQPPRLAALDAAMERAASEDDARKAAAVQARAAGIVGALAQSRAAFLGDVHVAASDVSDIGAVALGSGDSASSSGAATGAASGASSGSSNGASDGNSNGASDGNSTGTGVTGASGDTGTLSGDEIGDAYGVGGIGLSGIGEGGGGAGDSIGIGDIGTIGHGSGTGTGYGYGSGIGDLGGRRASIPTCTYGLAQVRGSCDADLVRRVMRAHANEVRFCYERVLQSRPTLTGRSRASFVIGVDGHVAASSASGFPEVDACVAAAIRRWEFSRYCAASIRWPIVFVPTESAP